MTKRSEEENRSFTFIGKHLMHDSVLVILVSVLFVS